MQPERDLTAIQARQTEVWRDTPDLQTGGLEASAVHRGRRGGSLDEAERWRRKHRGAVARKGGRGGEPEDSHAAGHERREGSAVFVDEVRRRRAANLEERPDFH